MRTRRPSHPVRLLAAAAAAALLLLAPVTAHAALAPAEQQTLTVNIGTFPSSIDPGAASYEPDLIVQNALFATLYRSPGGDGGALVPFLASRAPATGNGGRTWTIPLRAARWSDGRAITAADVAFAFTRARRTSYYGSFFGAVRSVRALGERTVRIELDRAVPWFDQLLASPVLAPIPTHVVKRRGKNWTQPQYIVTSGPFRLTRTRGASELLLEPNSHWWGARSVKLRQLKLLALPEASAGSLFDARRLDATTRDTSVLASQVPRRRSDSRFRTVPSGAGQYLYLNTRSPELASAAVRRALALAIDRAAMVQHTSFGLDQPLESVVPTGIRGAATVAPAGGTLLAAAGSAEVERARGELAAAGWVPGTKLDVYFATGSTAASVIGLIDADLARVGIDVVGHGVAQADFSKVGIGISPTRANVDAVLMGWMPDYSDPQNFHQLFTCANVDAGLNPSGYCDPAYDAAYAAATGTFSSFGGRAAAHRALEEQLTGPAGAMPAVPLYEPVGEYLVQPWVAGYVHHASGLVDFEKVSIRLK